MTLGVCHFKHTKLQVQVSGAALLSLSIGHQPTHAPPQPFHVTLEPRFSPQGRLMMEGVGRWGPEPEKECVSACGCSICPGVTRVRQVQLCP